MRISIHEYNLVIRKFNSDTFTMNVGSLLDNGIMWYDL